MEQLKVGIGADVSGLEKGLKDAEKALKAFADKSNKIETQLKKNALATSKLGAETAKLKSDFDKGIISQKQYDKQLEELVNEEKRLSAQSKVLRSDLAKLNQSTKDLGGKGFASAKKGAANAVPAVTEFSRVIQDAPFGIQGVANNITQLTQQFGYLTRSTGSSSAALKAMLGTLTGPAGILLVISSVTSLLVSFGDELFRSGDAASKLKKEQDKLTKSLEDYESTLIGVQKTELEGAKTATKELVTLRLLKEQLDDTSLSEEKRLNALKELQKRYPSVLSNISNEAALNKGLGKSYDSLVKMIDDKAKAEAASKNIVENTKKELALQSKLEAERLKTAKIRNSLDNANAIAQKRAGQERAGSNISVQRAISLRSDLNKQLKVEEGIIEQITKLQKDSLVLANQIKEKGGVVPLDFSKEDSGSGSVNKKVKSLFTGLVEANIVGREAFNNSTKENPLEIVNPNFDEKAQLFKEKLLAFNQEVGMLMQQAQFDTFAGFGEAIGGALANGQNVLAAAGASLLSTLGGIMVKYGKLILAFGVASEALKKALENPFGGGIAAIAAGVALIAIGGAIKGFAGNVTKSNGSTGSSRASSTGSGFSAPRASTTSNGGFSGGTVVFEIAGNKLVGVLSNTLQRNRNLGGTLSIST